MDTLKTLLDDIHSRDFNDRASVFVLETMEEITRRIPEILHVDPAFCPRIQDIHTEIRSGIYTDGNGTGKVEHHYGNETHFTASIPVSSAIYDLLGGISSFYKQFSRSKEYLPILKKYGMMKENEPFTLACLRPETLAFCAGLDNSGQRFTDKKLESAYDKGREAGQKLPYKERWFSILMVAEPATMWNDLRLRMCFSDESCPHSDIDWYVRVFSNPENDASLVAEGICRGLANSHAVELMSQPMPQTIHTGNRQTERCLERIQEANQSLLVQPETSISPSL